MSTAEVGFGKELARAGSCIAVHWKNVGLVVWIARAEGDSARLVVNHVNLLMHSYRMFSVIHVVEKTAGLPTKEGADRLVKAGRDGAERVACAGVLLSDAGILATMMSAFVRSTRMLVGGKLNAIVDHRLDGLVEKFVPLHVAGTGVHITTTELAAAITEARRRAALAL